MCILHAFVTTIVLLAAPPSPLEHLGRFDARLLPEASGIARSRRYPGIFWVHNDSGNPPALFAIRRDGTIVRKFRLAVPNIDWEDIAADDQGHLYVGDIGNNGGLLAIRAVYRIDEPDPGKPADLPLRPSVATFYGFPRGDRFDAESLVLEAGTTSAVLVAKRFDGREADLFAIPMSPPAPLLRPASPRRIGILPGFVEPATGASLSDDGQLLAVCSSAVTRVYRRQDGPGWNLLAEVRYRSSSIEGITWDGRDLILVSEGQGIDRIAAATWMRSARDQTARIRPRQSIARTYWGLSAGRDWMSESQDVVIVGGGVIGLSIAYALARDGITSTVLDRRELGREASWAGAGLIAPTSENRSGSLHPTVALRSWSCRAVPGLVRCPPRGDRHRQWLSP